MSEHRENHKRKGWFYVGASLRAHYFLPEGEDCVLSLCRRWMVMKPIGNLFNDDKYDKCSLCKERYGEMTEFSGN